MFHFSFFLKQKLRMPSKVITADRLIRSTVVTRETSPLVFSVVLCRCDLCSSVAVVCAVTCVLNINPMRPTCDPVAPLSCSHAGDQRGPGERRLLVGGSPGGDGETSDQSVGGALLSLQHLIRPRLHQRRRVAHLQRHPLHAVAAGNQRRLLHGTEQLKMK